MQETARLISIIQQTKQVNTMKKKRIFKANNVLILNGATRLNGNTDITLKTIIKSSENTEVKINQIYSFLLHQYIGGVLQE